MAESEARDFQLLDFFFLTIALNSLFLLRATLPSIYRLLKQLFPHAYFHKTSNPVLCRQTEFVYNLKIVH